MVEAAPAPALPPPVAFVTPYNLPTNAYIEMQKALVEAAGFEVQPFSVKHLLQGGGLRGVMQRRNLVLVQWLEMRAFHFGRAGTRLSLTGCLMLGFMLLVLACARARVVFFVHDHAVHDTFGPLRHLSRRLVALLCRTADARVVHDPSCSQQYQAVYLPHPLFWDRPQPARAMPPVASRQATAAPRLNTVPFASASHHAMLGAIRPYKAIDTILNVWPADLRLHIAGRCSADLLATLQQIIATRGLQQAVTIDARHQSDEEFEAHMRAADVLILPHATGTALVSGAFFEALGKVSFIVARRSAFIDWASQRFAGVHAFDEPHELPTLLARLQHTPAPPWKDTIAAALQAFGWAACEAQWGQFFASVSASAPAATRPGTPAPNRRQSTD